MWPEIMSRDWKLRSVRLLCFGLGSLGRLTTTVAKEFKDSMFTKWFDYKPVRVDFMQVSSMINE